MQETMSSRRRTVWVVDDSPTESAVARETLARDYDVRLFHDGSEALEKLTAGPLPDLLVLDWVMPALTGIELCQFLRTRPATAELPILLLTVQQNTDQVVEGLGAGANDYLGKPYAAPELRARVAALMRSRAMRERADHAQAVLRRVLRQLPDAVITMDASQRIVFVNDEAQRIFGGPEVNLLGRALHELLPDLRLEAVSAGPSSRHASLPDVHVKESALAPRVSIPPADDEGNTTFTLRDVTDVRRQEARQVDFYSMVAHDLRSPLGALHLRLQMMQQERRGPLTPEMRSELERMVSGVRELMRMINDFLDVEQIATGYFHIDREALDLRPLIDAAIEEYRALAESREIRLERPQGPPAMVRGDARRLRQVLANLLSNAIKFTPAGGVVAVSLNGDAATVKMDVRDTGPGISPEAQQRLFRKYERVGGSGAGKVEGTGLGLVIVKEIVEAHGGTVGVSSRPGAGSTFWLTLPRAAQG